MQKVFNNGNDRDNREILIKIEDGCISFYFYEQYIKHREWVQGETERINESGENDLSDDDSRDSEFYWIEIRQWKKDMNDWHNHMREKAWFTQEMEKFMDANP